MGVIQRFDVLGRFETIECKTYHSQQALNVGAHFFEVFCASARAFARVSS